MRFDLASPRTPGRRAEAQGDDGSVEWAAELATSTPAPAKGSSAYLRALPLTTRVTFAQDASKRAASKSQARFARYKTATTLLELQQLNPSKFMADLKYDLEKKLLTIEPEDAVFRALLVAAPPAPLALGTVELGDFVARGGERGFARDSARWASLRPHCPTLDRLCHLEDLEPSLPGPDLAGEPGSVEALLRFAAHLPAEAVENRPGLLLGAGLRGYNEIPFSLEGGPEGELASVLRPDRLAEQDPDAPPRRRREGHTGRRRCRRQSCVSGRGRSPSFRIRCGFHACR